MRTVSPAFLRELLAERSGVVPVILLTLRPPDMPVARLARAPYAIASRGETYEATWFDMDFADEVADEMGQYKLRVSNVHRAMVETLRAIYEPIPATVEMVTNRDFDTVEFAADIEVNSRRITTPAIEMTLGNDSVLRETAPNGTYNPRDEPSVFS